MKQETIEAHRAEYRRMAASRRRAAASAARKRSEVVTEVGADEETERAQRLREAVTAIRGRR